MILIRLKEVMRLTGLGRSTVYKVMKEGSFPSSVALGGKAVAWVESEVQEWILARLRERDGQPSL